MSFSRDVPVMGMGFGCPLSPRSPTPTHHDINIHYPGDLIPQEHHRYLYPQFTYLRPFRSGSFHRQHSSSPMTRCEKDTFHAYLDVNQFDPDEILVKVTGDHEVTIEGKHEDKPDEHGTIARHFVRKYQIPAEYDLERVESKLSSDGVLNIAVPKIRSSGDEEHRVIPVVQTGQPSRQTVQADGGISAATVKN